MARSLPVRWVTRFGSAIHPEVGAISLPERPGARDQLARITSESTATAPLPQRPWLSSRSLVFGFIVLMMLYPVVFLLTAWFEHPFLVGERFARCIDYISEAGIPEDQALAIRDRNAAALLGMPA